MDRNSGLVTIACALAAFGVGILVGRGRQPPSGSPPGTGSRTRGLGGPRSVETDDMVEQFRRQEGAVRKAIVELTMSLGKPGADQIGLSGKLSGMAADLTRIESRRQLAEADAAAITFPGTAKVNELRSAVGLLEAAIGQGLAMQELFAKTQAAIEAWKA